MQIEDYFNFLAENDIRIKGTRIGIETVLDEYIHEGKTAEAIAERYHTVTLKSNMLENRHEPERNRPNYSSSRQVK